MTGNCEYPGATDGRSGKTCFTAGLAVMGGVFLAAAALSAEPAPLNLVFACAVDNDLYRVMTAEGTAYPRLASASQAVQAAPDGAGVLILADRYPSETTEIAPAVLEQAARKRVRLYVEYPTAIPGLEFEKPRQPHWERTVVASDAFGAELVKLRILQIHDCHFLPVKSSGAHLVSARVAGYDKAVYGLPEETWPLLFEHPRGDILIATTKLSQFVSARYAPMRAWGPVWKMILGWLSPGSRVPDLRWTPTVRPSFARDESLPVDVERRACRRGVKWFEGFLVDASWKDELARPAKIGYGPVDPKQGTNRPIGNGRHGILEGHISKVFADGSQPMRWLLRGDCNAESGMALALGGLLDDDPRLRAVAANIMDFVYFDSDLYRGDPDSPTFGLLGWYSHGRGPDVFWGNDGSKAIVGSLTAAAALGAQEQQSRLSLRESTSVRGANSDYLPKSFFPGSMESERWDERILTSILANFRTTGPLGFRDGLPITADQLEKRGWQYFARRRTIAAWPQREGWAWACYLWLYDKTRYKPLLEQPRKALRLTMERYPDRWGYALHEMQMERGRILLPLAWLVRVDDTPEHRQWLRRIVDDMLARQDASGAIQEQLRAKSHKSNEEYGTGEVSILHEDGDPCADVFYSVPPALIGLVEAAAATGDPKYARAADKVAEFLVRIQVRSDAHSRLDGGWFRAFDFKQWDYWGANGDSGWGAWSSETGWVQSHIVAALAMRQRKTSLWQFTASSKIAVHFERYRKLLEIDEAVAIMNEATPQRQEHLARDKPVKVTVEPHPLHLGTGTTGLTDGELGEPNDLHLGWMGFRGADVNATIDLGKAVPLRSVRVRFLQLVPGGMVLPRQIELAVSDDGKEFRTVATRRIDVPVERDAPRQLTVKPLVLEPKDVSARYVRFRAESVGKLPGWHPAAGNPAWLFVDEIVVR